MTSSLRSKTNQGFTLVELLIATVVTIVGLLALALLIVYGTRLQISSREADTADALAREKIEELRVIDSSDPELSPGGNLNSNVADHFDVATVTSGTTFTRRWTVALDPSGNHDVTVAVVSSELSVPLPTIQIRALLPGDSQ
jgi:Tfp pilus assembly protein PilV